MTLATLARGMRGGSIVDWQAGVPYLVSHFATSARSRSSVDRASVSGTECVGSIPTGSMAQLTAALTVFPKR